MEVIGKKEEVFYTPKKSVYVIIEAGEKIVFVKVWNDYYMLGGGINKNEDEIDALKREVIEEAGYSIKNIRFFVKIKAYHYEIYNNKYFEYDASFYLANFDKKIATPIEKDYELIHANPNEYQNPFHFAFQNYALNYYVEMLNLSGNADNILKNKKTRIGDDMNPG